MCLGDTLGGGGSGIDFTFCSDDHGETILRRDSVCRVAWGRASAEEGTRHHLDQLGSRTVREIPLRWRLDHRSGDCSKVLE